MQITIIPIDQTVIVDGRALKLTFEAPAGLHALQWLGDGQGWLEFTNGHPNQALGQADFESWVRPYLDLFEAEAARLDSRPGPDYEWDGAAWRLSAERQTEIEKQRILAELKQIDLASIRPLRAIESHNDTPEDHAKLIKLEEEAVALRAEFNKS